MDSSFWKAEKCVPGRPSLHREIISSESELSLLSVNEDSKHLSLDKDITKVINTRDNDIVSEQFKNSSSGESIISPALKFGIECDPHCLLRSSSELTSQRGSSFTNNSLATSCSVHSANDKDILNHQNGAGKSNDVLVKIKRKSIKDETKHCKFQAIVEEASLKLDDLQKLSWSGVTPTVRPLVWKLLCNYLPLRKDWRKTVLERKRLEYLSLVKQYMQASDKTDKDIHKQISIDVPRMTPSSALFQQQSAQDIFLRILYIWSIRHPASGYVQGMNDLVTPFFVVFLSEFFPVFGGNSSDSVDFNRISEDHRNSIEADTFWCFSKFMEGIQDNYVFAQMGIQKRVERLKLLIERVDGSVHNHLRDNGVDYLQFSFRWMNNLLTRELPLNCCVRLWDTFLAESSNFANFQLYVYAAFLLHWREDLLKQNDFTGLMSMLQNLPSRSWSESDISVLMAEAYSLKYIFSNE